MSTCNLAMTHCTIGIYHPGVRSPSVFLMLTPEQNDRHFAGDSFKRIFSAENHCFVTPNGITPQQCIDRYRHQVPQSICPVSHNASFCSEWCIVGHGSGAVWFFLDWSINRTSYWFINVIYAYLVSINREQIIHICLFVQQFIVSGAFGIAAGLKKTKAMVRKGTEWKKNITGFTALVDEVLYLFHRIPPPWASYQIHKIACCACAGNAGNVFPATDFIGNH